MASPSVVKVIPERTVILICDMQTRFREWQDLLHLYAVLTIEYLPYAYRRECHHPFRQSGRDCEQNDQSRKG